MMITAYSVTFSLLFGHDVPTYLDEFCRPCLLLHCGFCHAKLIYLVVCIKTHSMDEPQSSTYNSSDFIVAVMIHPLQTCQSDSTPKIKNQFH